MYWKARTLNSTIWRTGDCINSWDSGNKQMQGMYENRTLYFHHNFFFSSSSIWMPFSSSGFPNINHAAVAGSAMLCWIICTHLIISLQIRQIYAQLDFWNLMLLIMPYGLQKMPIIDTYNHGRLQKWPKMHVPEINSHLNGINSVLTVTQKVKNNWRHNSAYL